MQIDFNKTKAFRYLSKQKIQDIKNDCDNVAVATVVITTTVVLVVVAPAAAAVVAVAVARQLERLIQR